MIQLTDHQIFAVENLCNGNILRGGTGSGKSLTALVYVFEKILGGETPIYPGHTYRRPTRDIPVYVITTPKKRDSLDWGEEASNVPMGLMNVDSWNNIGKYTDVENAIFIFDETKVIGYGSWTKSFLKITKKNKWLLLSATPADTWIEFMPVFIANGFYRNKTEFEREHVIWSRFAKYPKIDRYVNTHKLIRLRNRVIVDMHFVRSTVQNHNDILCDYDESNYKRLEIDRWNIFEEEPIRDISQLCYALRKLVNSDKSRIAQLNTILDKHPRLIIFYNFNYELEMLRSWCTERGIIFAEWNGHNHQEVPTTDSWVYLCQYTAAQEAWNCITTNAICFYSQTYSYKALIQSAGRIDRMNTSYKNLYYYHLLSESSIDKMIKKALDRKENFNEARWVNAWSQ